jgi:hypothetical protein
MNVDILLEYELLALQRTAAMPDDTLAGHLADLIDTIAIDGDHTRPEDLRDLGCAALITARRMEARP